MEVIFSKFSNDRRAEYAIRTDIYKDVDGCKYVKKIPCFKQGEDHVGSLPRFEQELREKYSGTVYEPNRIVEKDGEAFFEFLQGKSLETLLDDQLAHGNLDQAAALLMEYVADVEKANDAADFVMTEAFEEVFGSPALPAGLRCGAVTNIDMIPANVFLGAEKKVFIDYEWTFEFPVPAHYVLYRILHYYIEGNETRTVLRDYHLMEKTGITTEEQEAYALMEQSFQAYIIGEKKPLWQLHTDIVKPELSIPDMLHVRNMVRFQVFFDYGEGLDVDGLQTFELGADDNGYLHVTLELPVGVKMVRMDPGDDSCVVLLQEAFGIIPIENRRKPKRYALNSHTNASVEGKDAFLFGETDPQLYFDEIREGTKTLQITLSVMRDYKFDRLTDFTRRAVNSRNSARNYDELEYHYFTAMRLKADLEKQVADLNRRTSDAESKLVHIYRSVPYKLTKPFRMVKSGAKTLLVGTPVRRVRFDSFKMRLKGKSGAAIKAFKEAEYNRRRTEHIQGKLDRMSLPETLSSQREETGNDTLLFSILVPVYNTPDEYLIEMIESVLAQSYEHFELCIADGSDKAHKQVGKTCKAYAQLDSRIKYKKLKDNRGIAENTNQALSLATGDYIALFDHDDFLHPEALYCMAKAIKETGAEYVYTDEVVFYDEEMKELVYHLKPDFSPDFLRGLNYICHFSAFSRKLMERVGVFRSECDGSQDYDMTLRLTEIANRVYHIPRVLYFWRSHPGSVASGISAKTYCVESAKKALRDHLDRTGLTGTVEDGAFPTTYRIRYELKERPLISIVIPNKDHVDDLDICLKSVFEISTYDNFEVVIVENGSEEKATFAYYEELKETYGDRLRVITWDQGFNYAAINNFGAKEAKGEYLLLLNNDIEVITPDWMEEMLMYAQRSEVAAVGPMLYYENDTIQHAGMIMGVTGAAGHSHKYVKRGTTGYLCRLAVAEEVSGVTGACMLIAKEKFWAVGGLDESFAVAYNDVDFCCRLLEAGYLNVFTPFAELYHYESLSRGYEDTPEKMERFQRERNHLLERHKAIIENGDPYYNPALTLESEDYAPAKGFSVFVRE